MKFYFLAIIVFFLNVGVVAAQIQEQFFDSAGIKIHYSVSGKGEPVILVHGWASNGEQNWAPVVKELSANYKVVVMDCRGHGKSDKPQAARDYGVEMVEDVVRLMDNLKIKRAHVAGYSMGAMIVLKLLATHPDRVLSAVLAGQGGVRVDILKKDEEPVLKFLDKGMPVPDALIAAAPPGEKPSKTEQMLMKLAFANNDSKALAAAMRGFKDLLVTNAQLKKIKIPTLAIYSIESETVKPLKDLMPNVEIKAIEGANHTTAPFNPAFIKAVREFIAQYKIAENNAAPSR